jgi:two-component sensor histidine kinase
VSAIREVDSRVPRPFTENDISFLQTYANMVATAVNRLHLMNALRETAKEKGRLLLELQHRINNNLQVISALISTQSRRSPSPEVKEELKSIEDRIETLRLVHDKLYSAGDVDRVDLAPETAIPLGLIVNEFVTNSMKYAFEDRPGLVGLELVTNGESPATLTLWDDGKGFAKLPSGGTGMRLISGLLSQLHTKGQWRGEQGVRLVFELPCTAMIG